AVKHYSSKSNTLDSEIVEQDPAWAKQQVDDALAVLSTASMPSDGKPVARAARVLRFLETPQAAHAMAMQFGRYAVNFDYEFRFGLFASPHRKEAIADLEQRFAAPDQ